MTEGLLLYLTVQRCISQVKVPIEDASKIGLEYYMAEYHNTITENLKAHNREGEA